jgi:hypothetical protein
MPKFHALNGWYFERMENGDVHLTREAPGAGSCNEDQVIPSDTWCSIIAHVSALGETAETFSSARIFHSGRGH